MDFGFFLNQVWVIARSQAGLQEILTTKFLEHQDGEKFCYYRFLLHQPSPVWYPL